jgi:1,2-diacylglycerol-3-alpha-glucose alpha-1,2-galactosyltransferase
MQRVAVFSESSFTIGGHGVHTAFVECQHILDQMLGVQRVNICDLEPTDVLHVHSAGPLALALLNYHSGPKVITAHITTESFLGSVANAEFLQIPIERYLRFFYTRADLVLAVSTFMLDYLRDINIPQIRLVPNMVDTEALSRLRKGRSNLRQKLGLKHNRPVILTSGQIQPRKGIDEFIHTANAMPDADFIWVGGFLFGALSADRTRLRHLIASAPENVIFTGQKPRTSVLEYYAAADIFVSFSNQETFGLAILEAAGVGLPLVLRNLPVYRSIFNQSYISVVGGDYCTSITELIHDERKRATYSSAAKAIAQRYNSSICGTKLLDAYYEASRLARCRLRKPLL